MRTLGELVERSSSLQLGQADLDWLHLLMADWQVLADLAASDLVLWLPDSDGGFVAVALCRSGTSSTVHLDDIVGLHAPATRAEMLGEAFTSGRIVQSNDIRWAGSYSLSASYIPIAHQERIIAVLSREGNFSSFGNSSNHAKWTTQAADALCEMITLGEYPYESSPSMASRGGPRVNDGAILLSADGAVLEATPNANSCMRRLGVGPHLEGKVLAEHLTSVIRNHHNVDETLAVVAMGRASWVVEVEGHGATIAMRALPLTRSGRRVGAVLLTRDITETARREQELMTKDATIREIHHRVKNNLQTVSALLRMQSRRSDSPEVKQALYEAGRRVEAIATIHEALSHNVDEIVPFDDVAESILRMAAGVASTSHHVDVQVTGKFGLVPADAAAALATVLTELVTNSVEHGFPDRGGEITISAERCGDDLCVVVADNGVGMKEGSALGGLGTQIVNMMVTGELKGDISWDPGPDGGTVVTLRLNVERG
ncbi:histidine kinase N-terminal domain-containing protein [Actinomyces sp. F1_1611]